MHTVYVKLLTKRMSSIRPVYVKLLIWGMSNIHTEYVQLLTYWIGKIHTIKIYTQHCQNNKNNYTVHVKRFIYPSKILTLQGTFVMAKF